MRFGKTLANSIYPAWKDKYIEYEKLKKLLREEETSPQGRGGSDGSWTEKDEETFVHELIHVQLDKVHKHQVDTANELRDRTSACEGNLQKTVGPVGEDEEQKKQIASDTLKELDAISNEINELRKFSRVNYTGFLKAAKKHDRRRGQRFRVRPMLQVRLSQTPFNSEDYEPLLFRLSSMYTRARQILEGESEGRHESSVGVPPKDVYKAFRFWVHADNITEVKTYILRRLPVLLYNKQSQKIVDSSQQDPSITSIYFDSPSFQLYQTQVDGVDEAPSLRLQWSGQLTDQPEIVLNKKVVSEAAGSREIRVQLKQKYIIPFLKGEYKLEKQVQKLADRVGPESEQVKTLKSTIEEIQEFVHDKDLEPVLRAVYTRTAFQIPGDDRIRISLDADVALIREDALDADRPCRDPNDWHRDDIDKNRMEYPFTSIRTGEIARFEHAILEIKVKDTKYTRNNAWLADLMSSHLVTEAPKFSKFVHGVAELFEDYVNSFPFWLSELETDIRRDPQTAFEEEQDRQAQAAADELAVGSYMPSSSKPSTSIGKARFGSPRTHHASGSRKSVALSSSQLPAASLRHSDEQGEGEGATDGAHSSHIGLGSFLGFSNSRYAQRHRQGRGWEDAPVPPGVEVPRYWIKDQGKLKVEAKVWLANQRTFVKWQHIAILLATLSLGLFNAAGTHNAIARTLAVVYTCFAVFALMWGWGVYLWRTKLIKERSGKDFDNVIGPVVVSIGLAAALIVNFGLKYQAALERIEGSGRALPAAAATATSISSPRTQKRQLAQVRPGLPGSVHECGNDHRPPDERKIKLGKTLRTLSPLLPTILQPTTPLPPEIVSPTVTLHLFPSTHPHLPTVSGRVAYHAALWTAPVAWGSVPLVGNVKLHILSEKMVRTSWAGSGGGGGQGQEDGCADEQLVVKFQTEKRQQQHAGAGPAIFTPSTLPPEYSSSNNRNLSRLLGGDQPMLRLNPSEEFTGLFIFTFDGEGRIATHTIEHAEQGSGFDRASRVVTLTDWLLGKARARKEQEAAEQLPPGLMPGFAAAAAAAAATTTETPAMRVRNGNVKHE
ncbi:hypothetical protein DV737_g3991, partial [Chaetothyriales sp. CBS 132003]